MTPALEALLRLRRRDEERARAACAGAAGALRAREVELLAARRTWGAAAAEPAGPVVRGSDLQARATFARRLDVAIRAAAEGRDEAARMLGAARAAHHRARAGLDAVERRLAAERERALRARDAAREEALLEAARGVRRRA